jgi:hypothetical protein
MTRCANARSAGMTAMHLQLESVEFTSNLSEVQHELG